MIQVEWASRAFLALEQLPQAAAFDVIRRVDLLPEFPDIGAKLESRLTSLKGYRQLVIKRKYRVIYDFDELENRIYILAVQHTRQQLPSNRDLTRDKPED